MKKMLFLFLIVLSMSACSDSNRESSIIKDSTPAHISQKEKTDKDHSNTKDTNHSGDTSSFPIEDSTEAAPVFDRSTTIAGVDKNNDGIRDDIEAFIDSQPITPKEKSALRFYGYNIQQALLVDLNDRDATYRVGDSIGKSVGCIIQSFSNKEVESYYLTILEAQIANTKARAKRYIDFNVASSGFVFNIAQTAQGDECETR